MDKEIEYLMEQEVETIRSKCCRLSALCTIFNIDSREKLKYVIELADLFRECHGNEWINLKDDTQ